MTPEKLRELEALREKATQGEWQMFPGRNGGHTYVAAGRFNVFTALRWAGTSDITGEENAEYVAALHNAAPELIAATRERDELKRRLNALEEAAKVCEPKCPAPCDCEGNCDCKNSGDMAKMLDWYNSRAMARAIRAIPNPYPAPTPPEEKP